MTMLWHSPSTGSRATGGTQVFKEFHSPTMSTSSPIAIPADHLPLWDSEQKQPTCAETKDQHLQQHIPTESSQASDETELMPSARARLSFE